MTIECPNCHTPNRDGARFCDNCGQALPSACPTCGTLNRAGARFCDNCGTRLGEAAAAPEAARPAAPAAPPAASAAAPSPLQTQLHKFIPATLLAKLEDAQASGGMAGERRIVTVLFCDVKGSTAAAEHLDPEEWAEIMNGAFEHLITPVYHYEGTLARMMGDAILAFFGAPIGHEDDPQRAVLAGLEIVDSIRPYREQIKAKWGLDFDVRVGVNTGMVMVGAVGSDLHVEYTALGDAVNVAARMEQTARPGTVQIAGPTHRLVAHQFEFEALGSLDIKGKVEPMPAFRVVGTLSAPGRLRGLEGPDTPLVGREAELAALRHALRAMLDGQGQIVGLLGEAGLGKSRLVHELRRDFDTAASTATGRWLEAASLSYESGQAYGLLRHLLRAACGANENDSNETLRRKLDTLIALMPAESQANSTSVAVTLFGLDQAGQPEAGLEGESFRAQLLALMPVLCRVWAGQGPLVLVLEDLHWADPASVALLVTLLPLVNEIGMLMIYSLRPDEAAPAWQLKLAAERDYAARLTQVEVRPLNASQSGVLVDHLVSTGGLSPETRERILARAEGNPFFVEEVVRALVENGATAAGEADAPQFEIPDSLQSLLIARIDRLAEDARRTLQIAAIVGRSFYYRVLNAILGAGAALDERLGELEQANLIFEAARQPEREYSFRHALLQEAAYRTILRKHRREFHQRVGEALEGLFPTQLEQYAPTLAFHFEEAGDTARAVKYYSLAGDTAYRLFAIAEAESHYARAAELARRGNAGVDTLLHLYTRHGRVLELASRFKEAFADYEQLEALGQQRAEPVLELYGIAGQAQIRAMGSTAEGDVAMAKTLLARGLALAQSLGDQAAEAKLEWTQLNLHHWSDQLPEAIQAGEHSLALARAAGLTEQAAFSLQDLSYVYLASGQVARAIDTNREALGQWRQLRNQPMLANSLAIEAAMMVEAGEFAASLAASDEGYALTAAINNWWGMAFTRINLAPIYWDRGDPARSLAVCQSVLEHARRAGFIIPFFTVPATLADVYGDLGVVGPALEQLSQARAVKAPIARMYQTLLHAIEIRVYLANGQVETALALDDAQPRLLTDLSSYYLRGAPYYQLGLVPAVRSELGLLRGQPELAQALTAQAEPLTGQLARRPLAEILYWRARAEQAAGDTDAARATLARARAEAEALGKQRMLWRILALQAELASDPAQAQALWAQARAVVLSIADHAGSPELRASFLARPAVRAVIPAA